MTDDHLVTDASDAAETMPRRKPWLAGLLTLFFGVLGLVYCGRLRRACLWFIAVWTLASLGNAALLYFIAGPVGMATVCGLMLVPHFAMVVDAVRIARQTPNRSRRPYQRWWVYLLLMVGVAMESTLVLDLWHRYWSQGYWMPTQSMADSVLAGDRFLVDKLVLRFRPLRHGEVIAFFAPEPGTPIYCKRVIGLPGDVIEIRNEQVIRNGQPLVEPYAEHIGELPRFAPGLANLGPLTIPAGCMFLLGDNRRMSKDSRLDGPYRLESVVGVVRVVFWSREYTLIQRPNFGRFVDDEYQWGAIRWNRIGQRLEAQ